MWAHLRSSASVAGNDVNRLYERRLGQFPSERVLPAAIADEQNAQLVGRHCGWRDVCVGVVADITMLCLRRPSKLIARVDSSLSLAQKFPHATVAVHDSHVQKVRSTVLIDC